MVITSVNGWTLPAAHHRRLWNTVTVCNHSAEASLYYFMALCQWGLQLQSQRFFTCDARLCDVSRWNETESSIVCPDRFIASLEEISVCNRKKRNTHYPCVLLTILHKHAISFHFPNCLLTLFFGKKKKKEQQFLKKKKSNCLFLTWIMLLSFLNSGAVMMIN